MAGARRDKGRGIRAKREKRAALALKRAPDFLYSPSPSSACHAGYWERNDDRKRLLSYASSSGYGAIFLVKTSMKTMAECYGNHRFRSRRCY